MRTVIGRILLQCRPRSRIPHIRNDIDLTQCCLKKVLSDTLMLDHLVQNGLIMGPAKSNS